jgi:hypothetical protein
MYKIRELKRNHSKYIYIYIFKGYIFLSIQELIDT